MATKDETYEVVLADLKRIWESAKTSAVAWKKNPARKFSIITLPICTIINQTMLHADALQKNTDPMTRILLEEIKDRLSTLKSAILRSGTEKKMTDKSRLIGNATELLNTCKTTLSGISRLMIDKSTKAQTLYSELAA